MQLHELLAETARRFRDGTYQWAQGALAYRPSTDPEDSLQRLAPALPLDEDAICFCAMGGACRTAGLQNMIYLEDKYPEANALLASAIPSSWGTPESGYWPIVEMNDADNTTRDDVIAALERAAVLATPPDAED